MNSSKMSLKSFGSWTLVKRLGAGAFGEVHHWKHLYTGQEIATKRLKPDPKLREDEINILLERWSQEYEWMQRLTTECIVGAVSLDDNDFKHYLMERSHMSHKAPVIIMQYCNGGDLRQHLNKIENMNGLNEYEVRSILYTLLHAISYLHNECNIEHRDIKPDNIVLHIEGNRKIYKLADLGYAREIPESTMAQSVVGTRNYVAPEVVDSGNYKQSVDYWSAGHVAYEVICGAIPFLPHETNFVKRIEKIKSMQKNCINIVQKFEYPPKTDDDIIEYGYHLPLNNCSSIFIQQIETWLCLALDKNYNTRGYDASNELKFFSLLAEILKNNNILTVFSLKKHEKFYYDINIFSNMKTFIEKLSSDNDIKNENLFAITPPLHPNEIQQPSDYFVEEWCDISKEENPPVMLYVGEYIKQESDPIDIEKYFTPYEIVMQCFNINPQDPNIPSWFIQQVEKELHFLLAKQQNLLTCCMLGLQGFAIEIEKNVFYYQKKISELSDKILILQGNIQLFSTIVDQVIIRQNRPLPESTETRKNCILTETEQLKRYNNEVIKIKYKKLVQECRELAQPAFYTKFITEDRFALKEYRSFLTEVNGSRERIEEAQRCFENCVNKFRSFLNEKESIIDAIDLRVRAFNSLRYSVAKMMDDVNRMTSAVKHETQSLLNVCFTENTLPSQMHSLNIDGDTSNTLFSSTIQLNDLSLAMDCNSMTLINDSLQLMDIISQQCNTMNDSP